MRLTVLTAAAVLAATPAFADCSLDADATAGKAVTAQCKSCHVFEADKPSRPTGPNIHSVFGSKAADVADYTKWSDAMKAAAAKGFVWDAKALDGYLSDPKAFLNTTSGQDLKQGMFFSLTDADKRKQVIAYLKAIAGKPDCN